MDKVSSLRVYYLPNWDGNNQLLVSAKNQKEACRLMHCSQNGFRDYGGRRTDDPVLCAIALSEPEKVWVKRIDTGPKTKDYWKLREW